MRPCPKSGPFTPLESPAIPGRDDMNKTSIPLVVIFFDIEKAWSKPRPF